MKYAARLVLAVTVFWGMSAIPSEARSVYGVISFDPLGLLISPDADGFRVSRSSTSRTSTRTFTTSESEEVEGTGSWALCSREGLGLTPKSCTRTSRWALAE